MSLSFWEIYSLLTLLYIIPLYLFYLHFTAILFNKFIPEFQTSFFNLIKLLSIIDLILLPLFFFSNRLGHISIFYPVFEKADKTDISITVTLYILSVLQHAQLLLHLILAFNRFSATIMIKHYRKFWNIKSYWLIVITIFGLPGCYMSWILFCGGYFRYGPEHQGYMLDNVKSGSNLLRKSTMLLIVGSITCSMTLIMDSCTLTFLYNRRKLLQVLNKRKYYSDIRLFGVCLILFLVTAVYIVTELLLSMYAYTNLNFTYWILFPFQSSSLDLVIFISPISVLALNPKIRRHFTKSALKQSFTIPSHFLSDELTTIRPPHIISP